MCASTKVQLKITLRGQGAASILGRNGMNINLKLTIRGDYLTKRFPKVSPIVVFTKINDLTLVPDHLNQGFWRDFDSKFGVFWALSEV